MTKSTQLVVYFFQGVLFVTLEKRLLVGRGAKNGRLSNSVPVAEQSRFQHSNSANRPRRHGFDAVAPRCDWPIGEFFCHGQTRNAGSKSSFVTSSGTIELRKLSCA